MSWEKGWIETDDGVHRGAAAERAGKVHHTEGHRKTGVYCCYNSGRMVEGRKEG